MAQMTSPPTQASWRQWFANALYDPKTRGFVFQIALLGCLLSLGYGIVTNTISNLEKQGIASGFGFLERTAGFDISQTLINYSNTSTYARAFLVGLYNTLLVAVLGIILATVIGFIVGIGRLSSNLIIRTLATAFVELVRNIPPLLALFLIYFGVLKNLPTPRQSEELPLGALLNVRGLYVPAPIFETGMTLVLAALAAGAIGAGFLWWRAVDRRVKTGQQTALFWPLVGCLLGLPGLAFVLAGLPITFDYPALRGFNVRGGINIQPEFVALLVGLSLYTAAFIAEIVRSGILGVPKGQKEAAAALGLTRGQAMRLVIVPQAMRIIIPPLTNQYLNLTKNSSLAVAIGYPDLVSVFGNTVLSQTNQAVEVILIIMAVYLTISLCTSLLMNWFNRRVALVER